MNADYMILNCDARDVPLPDESVHLIVTSPPYWGLRKYAGEQELVWGGDGSCLHEWEATDTAPTKIGKQGSSEVDKWPALAEQSKPDRSSTCELCGAWKGSLGLEPTVQMYVDHIVQIFHEMRRILRKDGVAFLNIGDSYAANRGYQVTDNKWGDVGNNHGITVSPGLKPKDLCMIPARVALALQADGWWIRSDIIWAKGMSFDENYVGNPMCESVNDRPSRAHEYVFMLTKSQKYYWDKYAVAEPVAESSKKRISQPTFADQKGGDKDYRNGVNPNRSARTALENFAKTASSGRNLRDVWSISTSPLGWEMCSQCKVAMPAKLYRRLPKVDVQIDDKVVTKRQCGCESTDWISHFAAFPQKLIEPMVKAGTSEYGCCSNCGAPWKRDIEKDEPVLANAWSAAGAGQYDDSIGEMKRTGLAEGSTLKHHVPIKTLGWQLTCKCTDSTVEPCTVFDPFTGSGTSAIVTCKLGRKFIGTELSDDYVCLAEQRIAYTLENE